MRERRDVALDRECALSMFEQQFHREWRVRAISADLPLFDAQALRWLSEWTVVEYHIAHHQAAYVELGQGGGGGRRRSTGSAHLPVAAPFCVGFQHQACAVDFDVGDLDAARQQRQQRNARFEMLDLQHRVGARPVGIAEAQAIDGERRQQRRLERDITGDAEFAMGGRTHGGGDLRFVAIDVERQEQADEHREQQQEYEAEREEDASHGGRGGRLSNVRMNWV